MCGDETTKQRDEGEDMNEYLSTIGESGRCYYKSNEVGLFPSKCYYKTFKNLEELEKDLSDKRGTYFWKNNSPEDLVNIIKVYRMINWKFTKKGLKRTFMSYLRNSPEIWNEWQLIHDCHHGSKHVDLTLRDDDVVVGIDGVRAKVDGPVAASDSVKVSENLADEIKEARTTATINGEKVKFESVSTLEELEATKRDDGTYKCDVKKVAKLLLEDTSGRTLEEFLLENSKEEQKLRDENNHLKEENEKLKQFKPLIYSGEDSYITFRLLSRYQSIKIDELLKENKQLKERLTTICGDNEKKAI